MLLGRKSALVRLTLIDAAISLTLLALAAPFGLLWIAASRLVHGLCTVAVHWRQMQAMLGYRNRDILAIHLRSGLSAVAAVLPALACYRWWDDAAQAGAIQIAVSAAAGGLAWLSALRLLRHPAFAEITGLAVQLLGPLLPRRGPAAQS